MIGSKTAERLVTSRLVILPDCKGGVDRMPSIAGEGCRAGDCELGASGGARTGLGVCAGAREMVHEGAM